MVIFLAVYRRGQSSAREQAFLEEEDEMDESMEVEMENIPDIVTEEEDLEDDLELLEDLEDL